MTNESKIKIAFDVNGEVAEVAFAPHKTLLEVLREDLALTGTKHGCELGECGTCTVLLDGLPVLSCLVLGLACAGRAVRTVEGMAQAGKLHPLQETFADLGAAQCGYCTPAFLLAAEALLATASAAHAPLAAAAAASMVAPNMPSLVIGSPLPRHRAS
jgi:carbon-monoxide dehydrogenase small subunit